MSNSSSKSWLSELEIEAKPVSAAKAKEIVAEKVASRAKSNDVIGVGSGTTSMLIVHAIADSLINSKISNVVFIASSYEVEMELVGRGLKVASLWSNTPTWSFDGADEVDKQHNVIKGRGGALLREKILINASPIRILAVDSRKFVQKLGQTKSLPVEVLPLALPFVTVELKKIGATVVNLRLAGDGKDGPVISESGNLILDCTFPNIGLDLEKIIKSITGVIESGLFQGYDWEVVSE